MAALAPRGALAALLWLVPALVAGQGLGADQCKEMACSHGANIAPNARWRASSGAVQYLGLFEHVAGCEHACLHYKGKKGATCKSFVYHPMEGGAKCFTSRACFSAQCFAVTDDRWEPVPADGVISGYMGLSPVSVLNKAFLTTVNLTEQAGEVIENALKAPEPPKAPPVSPSCCDKLSWCPARAPTHPGCAGTLSFAYAGRRGAVHGESLSVRCRTVRRRRGSLGGARARRSGRRRRRRLRTRLRANGRQLPRRRRQSSGWRLRRRCGARQLIPTCLPLLPPHSPITPAAGDGEPRSQSGLCARL